MRMAERDRLERGGLGASIADERLEFLLLRARSRSRAADRAARDVPAALMWLSEAGCEMRRVVMRRSGPMTFRTLRPSCRSKKGGHSHLFAGNADAGRRGRAVRHEEVPAQRLARHRRDILEIGDALAGEERVVDQEMPGEALRGLVEDRVGRVRHDLGRARHAHHAVAAEQVLDRGGRDGRCAATAR